MTTYNVFYSWQSDLPNAANRSFIQKALEHAAKAIRVDNSIHVEPVIDRDTEGVPGAPDIAETIFSKIERSQVFVCDVSIVNSGPRRPSPNPNVLIELGYARKALGSDRVVMVMNTSFGGPEMLPFDLRQRRVVTYDMSTEAGERAPERRKLEAVLEVALRTIIATVDQQPGDVNPQLQLAEQARNAIESSLPNQTLLAKRSLDYIWKTIDSLAPDFPGSQAASTDDSLVEAIAEATPAIVDFARLSDVIAAANATEPAFTVYRAFGRLLNHYRPPVGFSGTWYPAHSDYYKFIGHELFVTFIAHLIRDSRWQLLTDLLDEKLYVENTTDGPAMMLFPRVSDHVGLLEYRRHRLAPERISLHADLLNERHTQGSLGDLAPFRQFVGADFFLFLREGLGWRPWSTIYLGHQAPRYLVECERARNAELLLPPLRVATLDELKARVFERTHSLREFFRGSLGFYPLEDFRIANIGTT